MAGPRQKDPSAGNPADQRHKPELPSRAYKPGFKLVPTKTTSLTTAGELSPTSCVRYIGGLVLVYRVTPSAPSVVGQASCRLLQSSARINGVLTGSIPV